MLGTGIPSAIGAKLGAPDREVVCLTGDGAAGFNIMEMQSAAREGLAVTTVVFAEGSWTMEEPNELELYGTTFGTAQGEIRWDLVAAGLGCHSEYVDRIEDLEPALRGRRRTTDRAWSACALITTRTSRCPRRCSRASSRSTAARRSRPSSRPEGAGVPATRGPLRPASLLSWRGDRLLAAG